MLDYKPLVAGMSDVQKLVFLATQYDAYDAERVQAELLRQRRAWYEKELTDQAARLGCPGRVGRLGNGQILSDLSDMGKTDSASITNTYNYDLAVAIQNIGVEYPKANRHVYASQLKTWEAARAEHKNPQIQQYTEVSARSRAQQDFYALNDAAGIAVLVPRTAVCPVCAGWIERGEVPLYVAQAAPPPYHINCPHSWQTTPGKVAREECAMLWMGQ